MASGRLALNKRRLVLAASGVACAAALGVALGRPASRPVSAHVQSGLPLDPVLLSDGDLVFRSGTDALASFVRAQSESSVYSHVGMLVHLEGTWRVVHAVPADPGAAGGVVLQPLSGFIAPELASAVGYFRIDSLGDADRLTIRNYLLSQVGKPFDYRFQASDDTAHYCTELVIKAIRQVGIDLEPELPPVRVLAMTESAIAPDSLSRWDLLRQIQVRPGEAPDRLHGLPTAAHPP